ncbi:hypothetical protein [Rhizobium gallicum]|uniref:hypothetical protein n=1 Tax=Rhizobium gallicum TaxID=56730 RepID=UPI000586D98C|nr:hypothetical protein [Rhizobium gallicum]
MILDFSTGDRFLFLGKKVQGNYTVDSDPEADPVVLRSDEGEIARISRLELAIMQSGGGAIKTLVRGKPIRSLQAHELKALINIPEKERLSEREEKKAKTQSKDVRRAARLLYYVQAHDNSRFESGDGLTDFIFETYPYAVRDGYDGKDAGFDNPPSKSAIRKALVVGEPGKRTLALYLRKTGGSRKRNKFPQFVYDLLKGAVKHFYEKAATRYKDAYKWFDDRFFPQRTEWARSEDAANWEKWNREPPDYETIRNWIIEARSSETLTIKYGSRVANRKLRGRGKGLEAVAPLETIILDQTLAPIWCLEKIEIEGETKLVFKRPWLVWAIDLYSRMVVGFILTYDPPNIATLMAGLRHVITPKEDWIARFGACKGATDAFGSFYTLILDNAKAHIGRTLQTVGDVAGFFIEYAPIYTPEFKPWIERFNATMNVAIRTLPGAIPHKDSEEAGMLDPRDAAILSLDALRQLLSHKIMEYHLEIHDGIGMAPARMWTKGLEEHGRTTVDDARSYRLLLRRHDKVTVTPNGINFEGHHFTDQRLISKLMSDNAGRAKKGKRLQAESFRADALYDEMDVSSIAVINPRTKEIVEIPNSESFYVEKPVSFAFSEAERAYRTKLNKAWHTREDKAKLRAEFNKDLEKLTATSSHGVAKQTIRVLRGGEKPEFGPGSRIVDIKVPASIEGRVKPDEVPISAALGERVDEVTAIKGRRPRTNGGGRARQAPAPAVHAPPTIELASSKPPVPSKHSASALSDQQFEAFDAYSEDDDANLDELARAYGFQTPSFTPSTKQ